MTVVNVQNHTFSTCKMHEICSISVFVRGGLWGLGRHAFPELSGSLDLGLEMPTDRQHGPGIAQVKREHFISHYNSSQAHRKPHTRRSTNAWLMLGQRRRRWTNFNPALDQRLAVCWVPRPQLVLTVITRLSTLKPNRTYCNLLKINWSTF